MRVLLQVTLVLLAVKNAECRVACRSIGYDSGKFKQPNKCLCIDLRDYQVLMDRQPLVVPIHREMSQVTPDIGPASPAWMDAHAPWLLTD